MKRLLIILLCALAFISCTNKGHQNVTESQEELHEWYYNVLLNGANDTTTSIPHYAFATDWMQRYVQYIEQIFELGGVNGGLLFGDIDGDLFDCEKWTMAYVDDDTIPELLLYGGCWASGTVILTQYGDEVYASPRGYFSYIKGAGGLLHSRWMHGDDIWGIIYEMKNGIFTEIASYSLNAEIFVDTSEVDNYGLTLDSLKCTYADGEIGDSVVCVSEIELNGKRIGACFGYNQCVHCTGFAQLQQTLDAIYYSKGTSTFFPITSGKAINELFNLFK
jgi:hypothetical protein